MDLSAGEPLARSLDRVRRHGFRHLVVNALDPLPEAAWHAELLHLAAGAMVRALALLSELLGGPPVTLVLDRRSRAGLGRAFRQVRNLRLVRMENRYPLAHARALARRLFGDRFPYDEPLTRHGVWVLDVETLPGFSTEAMVIPGDGHWNSAGHEFVAEQIQTLIETQQLLHASGSAALR